MNYESDYWFYPKAFSNDFCDKIINIAKKQKQLLAITNREEKQIASGKKIKTSDLKKRRNSNVVWLEDQFIYDEVYPILHQANLEAKWNIDLIGVRLVNLQNIQKDNFTTGIVIQDLYLILKIKEIVGMEKLENYLVLYLYLNQKTIKVVC